MLARDKRFKEFFVDKGLHLQAFIIKTINQQIDKDTQNIQKKKGDLSKSLESKMAAAGLSREDFYSLMDIVPILISKPEVLSKVVNHLVLGDYSSMAKTLLSEIKNTTGIKNYLKDNQKLFIGIIDQVIQYAPQLQGFELKGDLYEIIPALLDHPESLIKMIEGYDASQFETSGKVLFEMIEKDQKIKEFFQKNQKSMVAAAIKAAGLESYGIDAGVGDIIGHLMKKENASKVQKLMDRFHNQEWLSLAKDLCNLAGEDPEFQKYLEKNQNNFSKIVEVVLDKLPELRAKVGGKIGKLASLMITDPSSAAKLVEAVQSGKSASLRAVASLAWNKAFSSDARSAVYNAAKEWYSGRDESQQEVVGAVAQVLSSRDSKEKINLTDFLQAAYDEMSQNIKVEQRHELAKQIDRKKFFEESSLKGTKSNMINLSNLEMIGNQFVNTKFENVDFSNSSMVGVSFHGAKFNHVNFEGVEIDGVTLESLLPQVREGNISLQGVKFVGQLYKNKATINQQDLTNISFEGVDFSGVTSFEGVDFKGADLSKAILPKNPMLLADAYNLEDTKFPKDYITEEVLAENSKRILNKVSDSVASSASGKDKPLSIDEKNSLRAEVDRIYNMDNSIGEKFRKSLQEFHPSINIFAARLQISTSVSNISDYKGKTSTVLQTLFENKTNPQNLEKTLVANHIADDISERLFKEGNNRGADALEIRKGINKAITHYLAQNDSLNPMSLIENEKYEEMISALSNDVLEQTAFTALGMAANVATFGNSDRVQLKTNAINNDLIHKMKRQMNRHTGVLGVDKKKTNIVIEEMAQEIGSNLFGTGAQGRRSEDVAMISEALHEVVRELELESGGRDFTEILQEKKSEIVGGVNKGWLVRTSRTGLTEAFYKASENTTANKIFLGLKGGVQFSKKSITGSSKFMDSVRKFIENLIPKSLLKPIKKTQLVASKASITKPVEKKMGAHKAKPKSFTERADDEKSSATNTKSR